MNYLQYYIAEEDVGNQRNISVIGWNMLIGDHVYSWGRFFGVINDNRYSSKLDCILAN